MGSPTRDDWVQDGIYDPISSPDRPRSVYDDSVQQPGPLHDLGMLDMVL